MGNQILYNIQFKCNLSHSSIAESISSIKDTRNNNDILLEKKTLRTKIFKLFEDKEVQIKDNET